MPAKAVVTKNLYIYLVFLLIAFICLVLYQSYKYQSVGIIQNSVFVTGGVSTQYLPEVVIDTYGPPLRNDPIVANPIVANPIVANPITLDFCNGYPRNSTDIRGPVIINEEMRERERVPINIETRGIPSEFTQVGILRGGTDNYNGNNVLSLFGRQLMISGDKWQYYTLSNIGIMPTRLPIRVRNYGGNKWKDAMCEYGVDRLYSDDVVVVDGFDMEYIVQIYELRQYRYIG
jgi:hypothetical protein